MIGRNWSWTATVVVTSFVSAAAAAQTPGDHLQVPTTAKLRAADAAASHSTVNVVYLVPSDRSVQPAYVAALENAVISLRGWFRLQMPSKKTFAISTPAVRIVHLPHNAAWYSQNPQSSNFTQFWSNVLADAFPLTGGGFNDPQNIWAYYIDADPACGQCGGCGTSGVLVISANDLRGFTGQAWVPACPGDFDNGGPDRYIGGLGHELGHAFGLPHPPGCDAGQPQCDHQALMWNGFRSYPDTYLRADEMTVLDGSPFFRASPAPPGDLDGDGKSDLLWQNIATGQAALWAMNGLSVASSAYLPAAPPSRSMAAIADFDGDQRSDILWRNGSTGEISLWVMNGSSVVSDTEIANPSLAWVLQGVGDFDGDGRADILWRNSNTSGAVVWLMNGSAIVGSAGVASPTSQWSVQGVGDFDGDGKADILWRNSGTNEAWAWLMNGSAISSTGYVAAPSSSWSVKGVADFNGDGKADIVWRNADTNDVAVWAMSGTSIGSAGYSATPPPQWDLRAVGDFNGDGRADMMWRNTNSGENAVWLMNGIAVGTGGYIDPVPDQNWTVAGPR